MRVPLSWLKDYVNLQISNEKLADLLTLAGLEVDKTDPTSFSFKGVMVAEVTETKPHPHADKLKIVQVFDGGETLQIVCGDPQCRAGMKVALATIGATLTDKAGRVFKIKKSKLRNIESFGMLCSEEELGMTENSKGIMVLNQETKVGTDLTALFGDMIFEVSLTPNLGHCMSMVGVARDLAAFLNQKVKKPSIHLNFGNTQCDVTVDVKDVKNCYRYTCRKIRGVKVRASPEWMQQRLKKSGIKSVNNIVDATNYVMLELGQPLHAFDAKKIDQQKMIIQSTKKTISFKTLDGKKRIVPENILMIYDGKGPVAVAGVMGGANSQVDEQTTDIILEAAHFNPSAVRKGSKSLGLRSESSVRFERGIDFEGVTIALDRAATLISESGEGIIDKGTINHVVKKQTKRKIPIRLSKTNEVLGTKLSLSEIESFLNRLEMNTEVEGDVLQVLVPSYRNDIHYEIDLIEEIARIYGYNTIKKRKAHVVTSSLPHSPLYLIQKEVRDHFIGNGLQEIITCDLINSRLSELCIEKNLGVKEEIHVLRPSSIDQSILRTSFLPGMLQVVKHNFDRQNEDLSMFEIGRIHFKDGGNYRERLTGAVLLTGKRRPYHWELKTEDVDFFDLKGITENLLENLDVIGESFEPTHLKSFHPEIQGEIIIQKLRIGILGEVHPNHLKQLGIKQKIFYAQIDLHDLICMKGKEKKMTSLPQFPGSTRDWTITLHRDLSPEKIFREIKAFPSTLLKSYYLLDLYENKNLGQDKKNVTFRFTYRNDKQTVEQAQVDKEHERLIGDITKKFRDFIF